MFSFKRFSIEQDRTPMKVGTDGVLLGAWVAISGEEERILDIGTGTALIALMMAQRNSTAEIDGVEIDRQSAEQAVENVARSEWRERVSIHHTDIQSYEPDESYDLIVTNPPYFVDSLLSPNSARSVARHTTDLSFRELALSAQRLLKANGRIALILPTAESQLFDAEALGRLHLTRRCYVHSREESPVKRVMSEYRLSPTEGHAKSERLSIYGEKASQYSEEYRALTGDFYIK